MSKRRFRFSKTGMGKYISHLDLLRTFTRAIHRAELPVRYSQGFNPHQLITFALPLPIGVTSETEFVDIDFEDCIGNAEIIERLNLNLPPDIRIQSASEPVCRANDIRAARYIVRMGAENKISADKIAEFFELDMISAVKKTKKGEKEINLREFIKEAKLMEADASAAQMDIILSAGGEANIKPEIVMKKLAEYLKIDEFDILDIHRIQIFYEKDKKIKIFC